jgi:uncharacterized protein YndB with AHSA1/START domain
MLSPWSPQQVFQARADKEAWDKWWAELEPAKLIEMKKVEVKKNLAGWMNFIISELKP